MAMPQVLAGIGKRLFLATIVLVMVVAAQPSPAQVQTPCNETIDKFCKDVIPGGGRIMKCLNDHRDDQSIACKDWIADQMKSVNELMMTCTEEIATLCRNEPADRAGVGYCLLENYLTLRMDNRRTREGMH